MPVECACGTCGQTIYLVRYDPNGAIWAHYQQPEPYHDAQPPDEIREQFEGAKG